MPESGGVMAAAAQASVLRKQVAALKADVERIRGHRETYKAKLKRREAQVKKWKLTAVGLAVLAIFLGAALAVAKSTASSTEYAAEAVELVDTGDDYAELAATEALSQMPEHVWATGLIANSGIGGSAILVTPEGDGLSCGHCFRRVGEKFWYRRPDGVDIQAEVVVHVPWSQWGTRDLCLFHVNPEDVLAATPICLDDEPGALDVIGYPKCVGPVYHPLVELSDMGAEMRKFRVADGGYVIGGNSGSPIFKTSPMSGKGMVVGILSGVNNDQAAIELAGWRARERRQQHQEVRGTPQLPVGTTAIVTKQETLIAFVKANKRHFRGKPFCDSNGNCYDADGNLIQKQPAVQQPQGLQKPGPRTIEPNLPLPPKPGEVNGEVAPPPDPKLIVQPPKGGTPTYDGKRPQPKDLNSPRKKSVEIDKLRNAKPPGAQPQHQNQDHSPNGGEVAPPAEQPAPAPPGVGAGPDLSHLDGLPGAIQSLHDKVDGVVSQTGALKKKVDGINPVDTSKITQDVLTGVKAEVPKILQDHLVPVEQRLKDEIAGHGIDPTQLVSDIKGAVVPELPGIGKQIVADVGPQLKTGLTAHLTQILPGLIPATSAAGPGLLGMAGAVGGPVGIGVALAGWLLARGIKKQSDVSSTQTGVLAALVGHVANHTSAPSASNATPPAPHSEGGEKAPPAAVAPPVPDPGLANLFAALQDLTSQLKRNAPQSSTPAPAGAASRPAKCLTEIEDPDETITPGGQSLNQIIKVPSPPTVLQPGSIDRGANAWQSTLQMAAQKYPNLAVNGTLKRIDALFRQAFSGTSA